MKSTLFIKITLHVQNLVNENIVNDTFNKISSYNFINEK